MLKFVPVCFRTSIDGSAVQCAKDAAAAVACLDLFGCAPSNFCTLIELQIGATD